MREGKNIFVEVIAVYRISAPEPKTQESPELFHDVILELKIILGQFVTHITVVGCGQYFNLDVPKIASLVNMVVPALLAIS